jgi:SAM-dependent methyltransferase
VSLDYAGTLRALLRARLAQDVAIQLPLEPGAEDPIERIAARLCQPDALSALAAWTEGPARFRVAWSDGGHHRARAWALAQSVRRRSSALVNDSEAALWTARVRSDGTGSIELSPRLEPDPRFEYRVSEVRAASHPTLAAALARSGGVRSDDVVWDPFVGSGLELVERARLGAFAELWGSDIDSRAIAAARANLNAAGLREARLVERSALEFAPEGVSLVLTNPPMGRRVARDGSLGTLLEGFVRHVAQALRPGGRLVWLSPLAAQTARDARGAGLIVRDGPDVDLGGFSARLQICERPR